MPAPLRAFRAVMFWLDENARVISSHKPSATAMYMLPGDDNIVMSCVNDKKIVMSCVS